MSFSIDVLKGDWPSLTSFKYIDVHVPSNIPIIPHKKIWPKFENNF